MADDPALHDLLAESAIRRLVFRYARAVDRLDADLLRSCFHADATVVTGTESDVEGFVSGVMAGLRRYRLTHHATSNLLIEVEGDRARGEAYVEARHRLPAEDGGLDRDVVFGGRYVDTYERRAGEWRIASRAVVHDWSVVAPVQERWAHAESFPQGRRSREDPVYRRG